MHHVSTAHALLHIVSDPHTITSQVLAMYHFDAQAIATELQKMTLEADQTTPPDTNFRPIPELRFIGLREPVRDTPPAEPALLDKFGTDLTYEARRGRIDPVVGREREMERIVQILSRRKKNNPILIGEAAWARAPSSKGWPCGWQRTKFPPPSAANGSIRSTYRRSWPGPNTEVSSKNGCSDFSKNCAGSRTRSSSSTKYTPSRAQVRPREASTRPTFSNPPWRGANCRSSEPRRWTNIAKISRASRAGTPLSENPRRTRFGRGNPANPAQHRTPLRTAPRSALLGRSIAGLRRPDRALHYRPQLSGQGDRRAGRSRGTYSPAGQRQNRKTVPKNRIPRTGRRRSRSQNAQKPLPQKRRQRTRRLSVAPYGLFRPIPARPKSGPSISSRLLPP